MPRRLKFSVECLEAAFCLPVQKSPGCRFGYASPQKPEDGLSHSFCCAFRRLNRWAGILAISLALSTPFVLAQQPEPATDAEAATESNSASPVPPPVATTAKVGTPEQLRFAQQQGKADTAVVEWVLANAQLKGDISAGELRIAFTITPAEGWWDKAGGGKLAWHDAPDGNVHLRIFALDRADGRLVPGLTLRAALIDDNGNEQSVPADFGWYPLINAYGGNVPLDTDSAYTLRVTVDPLPSRHVFGVSGRFERTVTAQFPPVQITQEAISKLPLATDAASASEAELLKPCTVALSAAITARWQQSVSGAEQPVGDYFVGYALNYAGFSKPLSSAKFHLKNVIDPTGKDSVRLDLLPRDSRTGRLIPGLKMQANLVASDGKPNGPGELILTWDQWLNNYGGSARVPRKDVYKLHVHFDAPVFRRWGRQSERFGAPVDVEFDNISLKPEAKD